MLPLAILLFTAGADPARVTPHVAPTAPVETRAALDSLVQLPGTSPSWTLASELPCKFWPAADGTCRMTAATPGRYLVLATNGADVVRHVVIFEGPQPMPPVDPLKDKLTAAFVADTGDAAQKKTDVLQLAALYSAAVTCCSDGTCKTLRDLLAKIRTAGDQLTKDRLTKVREAMCLELTAALPALDTPLTDASRKSAADLFQRAETILEGLGK